LNDAAPGERSLAYHLAGAVAFLGPFAVYLRTLARDVTFVDSGELAAAAVTLGIAHPPGYPLFTLLGHAASWIPVGPMIFRVGLLSATAAAAASWLLWRTVVALMTPGESPRETGRWESLLTPWVALVGAALFALSRTVWSQATIVEVYALQAALEMAVIAAALQAARATGGPRGSGLALGFLFGLAITHHLTSVLLLPTCAIALFLFARDRRRAGVRAWPSLARTALLTLPPFLLLLYLPLRSRMGPVVNWDYPESWHRLLIHVSADQFRGLLGSEGLRLGELDRFLRLGLPAEATLVLPVLAVIGAIVLARTRPRALLLSAPVVVARLLYNMAYPIRDIDVYYVPVLLVLGMWAGIGAIWLARGMASLLARLRAPRAVPAVVVAAGLCTLALLPLALNFADCDLSGFRMASHYVRDVLETAEPRAVVFSGNWDLFSAPALYLQRVEGLRPDVVIFDLGRIESPTIGRDLTRVLPEVARELEAETAAVTAAVLRVERRERGSVEPATAAVFAACDALLRRVLARRPTYAVGGTIGHPLFRGYYGQPQGLMFRVAESRSFQPFPVPEFEGPNAWPRVPRTPNEQMVRSEYAAMIESSARYLEVHGRRDLAGKMRAQRGPARNPVRRLILPR
jgi:hypothetical protein